MSSALEKPMEQAVSGGFDALSTIDRDIIYLWLSKLAYGILYKELSLRIDRTNPEKGYIVDESGFREREAEFLLLQTILSNGQLLAKNHIVCFCLELPKMTDLENIGLLIVPLPTHSVCE